MMTTLADLKKQIQDLTERIAKLEAASCDVDDHTTQQELSYDALIRKAQKEKNSVITKFLQEWREYIPLAEICTVAYLYDRSEDEDNPPIGKTKQSVFDWHVGSGCTISTEVFNKVNRTEIFNEVDKFFKQYAPRFKSTICPQTILEQGFWFSHLYSEQLCKLLKDVFPDFKPDWASVMKKSVYGGYDHSVANCDYVSECLNFVRKHHPEQRICFDEIIQIPVADAIHDCEEYEMLLLLKKENLLVKLS